ncbi:hypothetical protein [Clostridium sp. BNL1100]|uniref:phage major capsid protein n=1 Tax=Clostridium sp. BNL1100 TaxID=755731 RepID=UPI00024A7767|nr:hypothetical protein [Clostridium sp. BNL1100]AEY67846.1 hypothetical protein Clo1100_3727 [Clostridium sp. BNL1100]
MSLIITEVYAGIVREKFAGKVKVANLAVDLGFLKNTTVGDTVTFPKFKTIGEATVMTKGTPLVPESLDQDKSQATIKQIGKAVRVFDIDDITAFGDQVNESATQQGIVFARKLDTDLITEALTTSLKKSTADAKAITAAELASGMNLFADEQDTEDMAGIVINSLLLDSFYAMNEFVDKNKTYTTDGNGIIRNGLIGYYRNIPVFCADHGTYDSTLNECITLVVKKNALAYMTKRDINIELQRQALLKATDVVGDFIYATKLIADDGVVVLKKTIA